MDGAVVFERFLLLAGLSAETGERWRPLCEAAGAALLARLREGADPADPRLALTAAAEACRLYRQAQAGGNLQRFSVGDISISEQETAGTADGIGLLCAQLRAAIADLLLPEGAFLQAVDG